MSTKIYNGYKINNINSLVELKEFCQKITPILQEEQRSAIAKIAAKIAVNIIDKLKFNLSIDSYTDDSHKDKKFNSSAFREAKKLVETAQQKIKSTKQRNPAFDTEINIVFIPIHNKILAMFYAEQSKLVTKWESFDEVEEYAYWDNTDRDENCTEDEWDQRFIDWEEALPGIGIPGENGFIWSALENSPFYGINEVLNNLPSDEHRINNIAEDLLWIDYSKTSDDSSYISSYYTFINDLKHGLKEQYEQKRQYVKDNLTPITREVLTKEIEFDFETINNIEDL